MRKPIVRAAGLMLGLVIACFVFAWYVVPDRFAIEQKRYEDALLGRTLEQAKAILESAPNFYVTKETEEQRSAWPTGVAAVGHWYRGPIPEDVIVVMFDENGMAARVMFHSNSSMSAKLRRWISF